MPTNLEVISDALRETGVISEIDTPSAEQGAHALRKLNEMMEQWTEDDVQLGYFKQSSTGASCPIPEWAVAGVKAKLAIRLAGTYGKNLSPAFVAEADKAMQTLERKCIAERQRGLNMDHMPRGEGHRLKHSILTDS